MATYERGEFGTTPQNIAAPQGGEASIRLIQQAARQSQDYATAALKNSIEAWQLQTDTAMRQQMNEAYEASWNNHVQLQEAFKVIGETLSKGAPTAGARQQFIIRHNAAAETLMARAREQFYSHSRENYREALQKSIITRTEDLAKPVAGFWQPPTLDSFYKSHNAIFETEELFQKLESRDERGRSYFTPYEQQRMRDAIKKQITAGAFDAYSSLETAKEKKDFLNLYEKTGGTMISEEEIMPGEFEISPEQLQWQQEQHKHLAAFIDRAQYEKNLALMRSDCEAAAVQEAKEKALYKNNNDYAKAIQWLNNNGNEYTETERFHAIQLIKAMARQQKETEREAKEQAEKAFYDNLMSLYSKGQIAEAANAIMRTDLLNINQKAAMIKNISGEKMRMGDDPAAVMEIYDRMGKNEITETDIRKKLIDGKLTPKTINNMVYQFLQLHGNVYLGSLQRNTQKQINELFREESNRHKNRPKKLAEVLQREADMLKQMYEILLDKKIQRQPELARDLLSYDNLLQVYNGSKPTLREEAMRQIMENIERQTPGENEGMKPNPEQKSTANAAKEEGEDYIPETNQPERLGFYKSSPFSGSIEQFDQETLGE